MITVKLSSDNHTESLVFTHFCETHGPSVVFTTQSEYVSGGSSPLLSSPELNGIGHSSNGNGNINDDIYDSNGDTSTTSTDDVSKPIYSTLSNLFIDESLKQYQIPDTTSKPINNNNNNFNNQTKVTSIFPIIISNDCNSIPSSSSTSSTSSSTTSSSSKCPTCSSIPQSSGLVSQDKYESSLFYVSTHQPSNNSYSSIRSACVRSLSCELVPGREGPVLIGSSDGCFLSYMFKVNDSRARGAARWYGFLFLLGDSACLVSYFGWVVSCFQRLAHEIKQRTNTVYNRERQQQQHQPSQTVMANMYSRRNVRTTVLKPLPELAEDPQLFTRLHRSFASILATCRMRYYRLVGQPPAILEEQRLMMSTMLQHYVDERNIEGEAPTFREHLDSRLRNAFPVAEELVRSLGQVMRIIGEHNMSALIYNVVVGNQVIVRGQQRELVGSLLDCLKQLLPNECVTVCRYSETFREIWECNMLGLAPKVVIPRHVDHSVLAIVDIDYYDQSKEPEDIDHPDRSTIEISFSGPHFASSMGSSIEQVVKQNFTPDVERIHLLNIKEEWINKAKAFYGCRSIIEDEKDKRLSRFMSMINCNCPEKDIMVLMYWTTSVRKLFVAQVYTNPNNNINN